jgi:selenocysteine lyase/cysteine desulfurase
VAFDVSRVRAAYPALDDGYAYLDGAAGTQVPTAVIEAIAGAYRSGIGNAGGAFPASGRADAIVTGCRRAIADLTGAEPDGVILGPNMTTLTYRLADTLSRRWGPGDEVVVSRLDHDANVRPWVQAAARSGATVRWAEVDASTAELPAAQFGALLSERTRLVAVTAASNIVGTRPDVPGRFERGTAAFADLAGVTAAVDHLAALDASPAATRRERVLASMAAVERYEGLLFTRLLDGLAAMPHVTLYGPAAAGGQTNKAARRTPTAFFTVAGYTPREVAAALADRKINVWNGDNYAWELVGAFGLRDSGGGVRAGLVHYNDGAEVDRLLTAVADLASGSVR